MVQNIAILGSTGSIGTQAIDVAQKLGLRVSALTANSNVKLIEQQARALKPKLAVMYNEDSAKELKLLLRDTDIAVLSGMDGLCEAASIEDADIVLNSLVGMVGLQPTLAAANAKKDIALANKEALVAGGALVTDAVKKNKVKLLPVDSEHSAIFQCLQGCPDDKLLSRIILTASGGPFFGCSYDELRSVTPEQALKHPNWDMGAKITIDSATMMNKGLEIIEAAWLFNMTADKIDVVVHRESIIHSLIEYVDNSVIAQLGVPDMRIPIQYAITYPMRCESPVKKLDLTEISKLTFFKPDEKTFKCMYACKEAISKGGAAPIAANGANEVANLMFRQGKISFTDIGELVYNAMERADTQNITCVQDVLDADNIAREYVHSQVGK